METGNVSLKSYFYELPEERIAKYPLKERDSSKLLIYKDKELIHESFRNISRHLPDNATLFFNNTKVIPARLLFQKQTGATIELFLLHPVFPSTEIVVAMQAKKQARWKCMVGNLKKWKNNEVLVRTVKAPGAEAITVHAELTDPGQNFITLSWNGEATFAEMVHAFGEVPLPPYLNRKAEASDKSTYQTIYSQNDGAVAAPTAGLHFTPQVMENLKAKNIATEFLTLHVGAGTFQPIKHDQVADHPMHSEQIILTRGNIEAILKAEKIVAVGTTSMRTLESLYWFGAGLILDKNTEFKVAKLQPYQFPEEKLPSKEASMTAIKTFMQERGLSSLTGSTEIFIFPGYKFRVCEALITNFHQPGSTLILLVAAFVGPGWRDVYASALNNQYRFLSYGDSSLLFPSGQKDL